MSCEPSRQKPERKHWLCGDESQPSLTVELLLGLRTTPSQAEAAQAQGFAATIASLP